MAGDSGHGRVGPSISCLRGVVVACPCTLLVIVKGHLQQASPVVLPDVLLAAVEERNQGAPLRNIEGCSLFARGVAQQHSLVRLIQLRLELGGSTGDRIRVCGGGRGSWLRGFLVDRLVRRRL